MSFRTSHDATFITLKLMLVDISYLKSDKPWVCVQKQRY